VAFATVDDVKNEKLIRLTGLSVWRLTGGGSISLEHLGNGAVVTIAIMAPRFHGFAKARFMPATSKKTSVDFVKEFDVSSALRC